LGSETLSYFYARPVQNLLKTYILGTAGYPLKPLYPDWIPIIQGMIMLAGLYFGVSRGYAAIKEIITDAKSRFRAMILPSIFALVVINIFLRLYMG